MDSRAKQRLTGAVILVALFVLLVPELLRGPRGTETPAGAPGDEGMRRYTIDLDAATPAGSGGNADPAQPAVSLPQVASSPDTESETSLRATPGESAAPAVREPEAEPEPRVAAAATPNPVTPSPAPFSAPVSAAPRAEVPRAAATTPVPGSFVVQLGSFGSRENADRLVKDMTGKGFAAFVAPIKSGGRELYRVRVGPTRDRPSAEALATQLRRAGQSGSIVPIS